jgi:predicted ester cyclase
MSQENKDLIHRWFSEVWNKGNNEAIDEMLTDTTVIHGLTDTSGLEITGPDAFRGFHKQFRDAFEGIEVTVEDTIAEGDKVVARCRVRGKHSGDSLGFAPTQADVEFTGIAIVRVSEGKIVEAWNNFDFMKMSRQLGVL